MERPHGLYILSYTLYALKNHTITPRQAILLAQIDRFVNPYWTRHEDEGLDEAKHDLEREIFVEYSTKYLKHILACSQNAVHEIILDLRSHRNHLLKVKRLGRCKWRLATKQLDYEEMRDGSLNIAPPILKAFENREITPMEMMIAGKIASFEKNDIPFCYASNKWIGSIFGVQGQQAQKIVQNLKEKNIIKATSISKDNFMTLTGKPYFGRGGGGIRLLKLRGSKAIPQREDEENDED